MPRIESRTKTAIWADEDFRKLTGRAQRMYWLLYSQPTISLCGVLALTERRWANGAVDETVETVRTALEELQDHGYVLVDFDTEEVFVRSFARHDGVARSPKTFPVAWKQLAQIASSALKIAAEKELALLGDRPSDTPLDREPNRVSDAPDPVDNLPTDRVSNTPPDRTRGRAHAVSSLRLQSPSPVSSPRLPTPSDETGTGATHRDEGPTPTGLADRLARAVTASSPEAALLEAHRVVSWALRHVDRRLLEEAIGWAESKRDGPQPVRLPRGITSTLQHKAADKGVTVPAFNPSLIGAN